MAVLNKSAGLGEPVGNVADVSTDVTSSQVSAIKIKVVIKAKPASDVSI